MPWLILGNLEATDDDFGQNANITYTILINSTPFTVSASSGEVRVTGKLDIETKDKYCLKVLARDNAKAGAQLSSSVEVDVNILDVNDNAPEFYGYDELLAMPPLESKEIKNHQFGEAVLVPVYYATMAENSIIGTAITRVFANDSDFPGNGNGLLLFAHRYYEVELEENIAVPVKLLSPNVSEPYQSHRLRYTLVSGNDIDIPRTFKVDPKNGTVYVIQSPDRERRRKYEFKIRLDRIKLGRGIPVMVYPITPERLTGLALNEVKVIVRVIDVNDNVPKFTVNGRPIVAAIPTSASYAHLILKLHVYVIDERKQLVMVMGSKPTEVEKSMDNIMTAVLDATGYDIRVRKLEPYADRNLVDYPATNM